MPGRRLTNPYIGFRSEQAAIFALSPYASVVKVPLEEDYGSDLICTLIEEKGKFLIPSNPFLVQVKHQKDNYKKIVSYNNVDAINWFLSINMPFYICIVNLYKNPGIELYNTIERIPLKYYIPNIKKITLFKGICPNDDKITYSEEGDIWLGKPIIRIPIEKFVSKEEGINRTLRFWLNSDQENLLWDNRGFKIFKRIRDYQTNNDKNYTEINKIFYNLSSSTESQKNITAIALLNEIVHEFADMRIDIPRTAWYDLSIEKQNLFKSYYTILNYLDSNLAMNIIKLYPESCNTD